MPHGKDTIEEFIHSFQRGEEKGFAYFFKTLYPVMFYYAFRICRNKAAAKDIVESSFIRLWEKHSTFSHSKLIKSWLYINIRNACIDWLREQRITQPGEHQSPVVQDDDHETRSMQEMIRSEVAREMYAAITDLPPRCQQVFKLIYIQGKTLKEAAEEMELSIYTVKNHKARGLNLLKRRIPDLLSLLLPALFLIS